MSEFWYFIVTFFDLLLSFFYSAYRIVVRFASDFIIWLLIIVAVIILCRTYRMIRARVLFVKDVRAAAEDAGAVFTTLRNPLIPFIRNLPGYDMELSYRGKLYRIKLYPGSARGRVIHMKNAHETVKQPRFIAARETETGTKKQAFGRKKLLSYDNTIKENTVNILLFSPPPTMLTERSVSGGIWELGSFGDAYIDGVYLFSDELLKKQILRVLEGYIDNVVKMD